jgi:hypothetical protein
MLLVIRIVQQIKHNVSDPELLPPHLSPATSPRSSRKGTTLPTSLPSSPHRPAPRPLFPSARRPPEQPAVDLQTRRTSLSVCFPGEPSTTRKNLIRGVQNLPSRGVLLYATGKMPLVQAYPWRTDCTPRLTHPPVAYRLVCLGCVS